MKPSRFSYDEMVSRNRGIVRNQDCLKNATIAIAGCGGAGGESAVTLARMGVGHLKLAEPDLFDCSNVNRQFGATASTIGLNKAQVIADTIADINPECKVEVFELGVDLDNIDIFLQDADLALEEIDYRSPKYTAILHRGARKRGIPVMTALPVAWGSFFFFFTPQGMTFEEYVEKDVSTTLEEFDSYSYPILSYCPEPPLYLGKKVISDVINEVIDIPAVCPAVNLTAGILASFVYFFLSGERKIKAVPYYYSTGDMFNLQPTKVPWIKRMIFRILA